MIIAVAFDPYYTVSFYREALMSIQYVLDKSSLSHLVGFKRQSVNPNPQCVILNVQPLRHNTIGYDLKGGIITITNKQN